MARVAAGKSTEVERGRQARLDRSLDGAILEAALAALTEFGYDRMSMDDVAARAGVGKAAIYRRWSSKETVVAEAIAHWRRGLAVVSPPNTGSLRGDLDALVAAVPEYGEKDLTTMGVVVGISTAASGNPVLAAALEDLVLSQPRRMVRVVLDQAVARGEIPADREISLIPDVLLGLNMVRIMTGRPADRLYVRRMMEEIVLPLVAAPLSN